MARKFFKIIFLFVALNIQATAQTGIVQLMEGEIRAGVTTPLGGYHLQ